MLVGFPQQVPLFQAAMSASCWQRAVHQRKMLLSSLFLHSIHQQLDHKICQSTSVWVYKYSNVAAHWLVLQQIKDFGLLKLSMALSWRMLWEDWYSFEVFHYAWVMADELFRRGEEKNYTFIYFGQFHLIVSRGQGIIGEMRWRAVQCAWATRLKVSDLPCQTSNS